MIGVIKESERICRGMIMGIYDGNVKESSDFVVVRGGYQGGRGAERTAHNPLKPAHSRSHKFAPWPRWTNGGARPTASLPPSTS